MAKKKTRTPPPPRRVQAPQQRSAAPPDGGLRHRAVLYGVSGAGALALVIVVLVVALGGGASAAKALANKMSAAGCTFKTVKGYVPPGQPIHVPSLTKKLPWNTDPPSNGQHYPFWAVWGFYTSPVDPHRVVHNEEHGGVVLWWGSKVPQSTVDALRSFYDEQPDGTFGTPYPKLGSRIAITAWTGNPATYGRNGDYGQGHIAICTSWSDKTKKAFTSFRSLYRGHGPEGVPLSADEPGMGPPQ